MSSDLIRAEISALPDYNAGLALDRFRDIYGTDCLAKLDSNESPLGASPHAIAAIKASADGIARYPDATNAALRAKIARSVGSTPERVIIGNGSEDLIGALFRAVLRQGDHVVTLCPSFGLHEFGALSCGATVTKVPFAPDWSFPLEGLRKAMAKPTRILIFASPSNPAGPAISKAEFRSLLDAVPQDTLIVFDEAYLEYIEPSCRFDALAILAEQSQSWITLRTLSKAYGLAGIRVGYGIASDDILTRAMMKTRNPFGVNALAVAAAMAALDDVTHLDRVVDLATKERDRVSKALIAKGYPCAPSQTNFVFFDAGASGAAFAESLRQSGVLIKGWLESPYESWARVTMGSPEENDIFLNAVPDRHGK